MNKNYYVLAVLLVVLLFGCYDETKSVRDSDPKNVVIGTFNVEWLGDGVTDRVKRDEADYKRIAKVIEKTSVDIMALQEIENAAAMKKLMKYLPDYKYHISKSGGAQKLAVVYKGTVKVKNIGDYTPLEVKKRSSRPGLIIEAKKGNFDFKVMVVHFKSTSRWDNTPAKRKESVSIRRKQAEIAADWVIKSLAQGKEKDLMIIGDFNDTPHRKKDPTLNVLEDKAGLVFLTRDMKSCKFSSWFVIDHIAVTKSAAKRFLCSSPQTLDIRSMYNKEETKRISDHCPIYAKFEIVSPDND